MVRVSKERRQLIREFLNTPKIDRPNEKEFRLGLRLGYQTFLFVKNDIEMEKRRENRVKDVMEKTLSPGKDKVYNSDDWLSLQAMEADKALMLACDSGNAQALRTYYQLTKRLIEKQEVVHTLSPELIERSRKQAELEIEGEFKELPDKPPELE